MFLVTSSLLHSVAGTARALSTPNLQLKESTNSGQSRSVGGDGGEEEGTRIDIGRPAPQTKRLLGALRDLARRIVWLTRGLPMIEAEGLTKHYGTKVAVDNLSFSVRPGVVTGFLGPNGSGKSTTMRMIMGLDYPTRGQVKVNGKSFYDAHWPLREVGALLEARAIHPGRSARAHLLMLAQTSRLPKRRVDDLLELVGLSAVADQRAGRFSLGMGQRLGIAAALLGDPGVLLFDEPVNGLDPDGIRWVRHLLKGLASDGRTVFVSSHLMSEMALTADEVIIIGRGHLIEQTSIDGLLSRSSMQSVRVRSPQIDALRVALEELGATTDSEDDGSLTVRGVDEAAIGDLAGSRGIVLHELSPQTASLEEAFMELTEGSLEYRGAELSEAPLTDGTPS